MQWDPIKKTSTIQTPSSPPQPTPLPLSLQVQGRIKKLYIYILFHLNTKVYFYDLPKTFSFQVYVFHTLFFYNPLEKCAFNFE